MSTGTQISIPTADGPMPAFEAAPAEAANPDADHGFHCNDRPAVFNPAAATDAWSRTLDWFDRYIGS